MAKTPQPPWVVQFDRTSKPVLVAPFNGCRRWDETPDMPVLQGKRCLGRDGDWSLMLDDSTDECSLVSLADTRPSAPIVIALPPLPDEPNQGLQFACALSGQTPPDCTVLLDFVREKFLLHCRPGDPEWSRLPVELVDENDVLDGPITPGYQGKVYATTMASFVVVDASSSLAPVVERADMMSPPQCPLHPRYKCYPVPCPDGELFLVRCCIFGCPPAVVEVKVFRWNDQDNAWETVETIGDKTFFVGRFTFAVPSAAEAGTQPNCIHVLCEACREFGIYTVSLDDATICLGIVEGCHDDDDDDYYYGEDRAFWALPTSFGLEAARAIQTSDNVSNQVTHRRIEHCCGEQEKGESTARPWSDLHIDLLQLLVPKISFIDLIHLRAVCKQWNSINSPIQHAKVSPLLMTTRRAARTKEDLIEIFDPVGEKKYSIRVNIPTSRLKSQGSQLLHYTKNGWVIVSRGGDHIFFLVNPFKNYPNGGHVIALPPLELEAFKGFSFSSVPGSPDFVVLAAGSTPRSEVIIINTWRMGDEEWKEEVLSDDDAPFFLASHNPVFLDGVFYLLDINGRLGVIDPSEEEMEFSVLKKPDQPIRGSDDVHPKERDYNYLVEWKGELIAIFRETCDASVRTFKLERSQMVWLELQGMEDAAVFWDRTNALIHVPPAEEDSYNKVFLPNYNETDGGGRMHAFYSFREQCYYPSFYAKEPMNAIWFQPDLDVLTLIDQ
uniref:KIB1-4 beta-propeller domain-containing protein n=1 Tax=Hordeum vulgare subsp. vulgare TaxID=112509 RepID=A0A8I6X9K1_HORVV